MAARKQRAMNDFMLLQENWRLVCFTASSRTDNGKHGPLAFIEKSNVRSWIELDQRGEGIRMITPARTHVAFGDSPAALQIGNSRANNNGIIISQT